MTKRTVIRGGRLLTMAESAPGEGLLPRAGTLVLSGDTIEYIGPGEVKLRPDDELVDGRGKLYMPGFVNTHGHAGMSLLRGLKDDVNLQTWLQEYMWPTEARFTASDVRAGAELAIAEMLKSGTTTFMDMYDYMDQVAEAVEETGMRACLTRGVIGLCSEEEQRAKLDEAIRFAKSRHGAADGRITTAIAPHAPYTCPPDFLEKFVDAAHALDLPMHTHMSETAREVEENVAAYGVRPVEHLRRLGVFSRPCLVAHGVHLNDEEISILAEHGVGVSHNPGSNLKLASGIARVPELLAAGVRVSLGTDSAASNNNLDVLREIRLAALIHKGVSGDPTAVPAEKALAMGTVDGARSLWLRNVGTLEAGMKADVIAIDVTGPQYQPETSLVSHLVYAGSSADVTDVWVNGRPLVRGRVCLTIDEERVVAEANAALRRVTG